MPEGKEAAVGKILRYYRDTEDGFILQPDGEEIYFRAKDVRGFRAEPAEGTPVQYVKEKREFGDRAKQIELIPPRFRSLR